MTLLLSCGGPQPVGDPPAGSGLMSLEDDPNHDFWRDWKVAERAELPAEFRTSGWAAFDYATLTETDIEMTWAAISTLLGAAKSEAPTETQRTLTMIASTLEPGPQTTHVGLDFLWIPEASPPPEAMLITLDGLEKFPSTLRVLIERPEGQPPNSITLWMDTGAAEGTSPVISLSQTEASWSGILTDSGKTRAIPEDLAKLSSEILLASVWGRFTGPAYVALSRDTARPHASELKRMDRGPFSVQSGTAFPPRMSDNDLNGLEKPKN